MLIAAQSLAPWADEGLPYTDPLGLCSIGEATRPPEKPPVRSPLCDAASYAADPRCHLNAPVAPPAAPKIELRFSTAATASVVRPMPPASWRHGFAPPADRKRDGYTRDIDHPPR